MPRKKTSPEEMPPDEVEASAPPPEAEAAKPVKATKAKATKVESASPEPAPKPVKTVAAKTAASTRAGDQIMAAARKFLPDTSSWNIDLDPATLTESRPCLSTGSFIIDYVIGGVPNSNGVAPCPGIPRAGLTQVWGAEGAGKSTIALSTAAATAAAGGFTFYVDWEHAVDARYAKSIGVPIYDEKRFKLVQPSSLEDGIKLILIAAKGGADLIVIDSVGSAVPSSIASRSVADAGEQARIGLASQRWTEFLPQLRHEIMKTNSAVLGISQVRAKIGGMSNGPQTEPQGGNAWKFNTDLRFEVRRIQQEKVRFRNVLKNTMEERPYGSLTCVTIKKSRVSDSAGRQENFYLRHGQGIDNFRSVLDLASIYKIVQKAGAYYKYDQYSWQGIEPARAFLTKNPEVYQAIFNAIRPIMSPKVDEAEVEEDEQEGNSDIDLDDLNMLLDGEIVAETDME